MLVDATLLSLVVARKPPFFEGLTPSDIATILVPAVKRTFPANTVITDEGHAADRLFLVLHGRTRGFCVTSQGQKITVLWFDDRTVTTACLKPAGRIGLQQPPG